MTNDNSNSGTCRTEACEREATHYVEYPSGRGFTTGRVCIPCLKSLEVDSQLDDRRGLVLECL